MPKFIILAAMKGQFISASGNIYDNFQMMGYIEAGDSNQAITSFFDQTPYPIQWADVDYLGADDRKSVVEGKSVDLGGRGIIKKKKIW